VSLSESVIKQLTGGDSITARYLHKEFFEFRPEFKLVMVTNHKPCVQGTHEGLWRRIVMIPFQVFIPPEERNRTLLDELKAEAPGILNWMLNGYVEWKQIGLAKAVDEATSEYREEMDTISAFLRERCDLGSFFSCSSSELYQSFAKFCESVGEPSLRHASFVAALEQHDIRRHRTAGQRRLMGVALKLSSCEEVPLPSAFTYASALATN
jgi:putative DNA primase/helicase